jgi:parallel beta-helix repeat protein
LIGIDTEISDTGIIANNRVSGGTRGVFIYNTGNVKVFNNSFTGQSVGSVFLSQDYRRQASAGDPGHDPRAAVPDPTDSWLLRNITVANNTFGGYANGGMFQFYALDNQTNRSADSMNLVISGNAFVHRDNSSQPTMVGWGGGDNHTITRFETPAQLAAAKNPSWTNLQPSGSASNTLTTGHGATSSAATPLPSDVAQAVGQAVGTKRVGTF